MKSLYSRYARPFKGDDDDDPPEGTEMDDDGEPIHG